MSFFLSASPLSQLINEGWLSKEINNLRSLNPRQTKLINHRQTVKVQLKQIGIIPHVRHYESPIKLLSFNNDQCTSKLNLLHQSLESALSGIWFFQSPCGIRYCFQQQHGIRPFNGVVYAIGQTAARRNGG